MIERYLASVGWGPAPPVHVGGTSRGVRTADNIMVARNEVNRL